MSNPALKGPMQEALDLLKLYAELDLRLIPSEPSEAQCRAGAAAGNVSPERAAAIFRAMLAADESES